MMMAHHDKKKQEKTMVRLSEQHGKSSITHRFDKNLCTVNQSRKKLTKV